MADATSYDIVAYPSMAIPTAHPDHLATIARLHGLTPPPVETARVLDIGGGDGMNLIAMAEALPDARFLSIDLAETAVRRGRRIAADAGLGNVRVELADIVASAEAIEGPFDYIVSHGVYAWVPQEVRAALLALIERTLAPDGVAFVSYNALPGAYLRTVVRDLMLDAIHGVEAPAERDAIARRVMADLAVAREDDEPPVAVLRAVARRMAEKESALLLHDELGETYAPQRFTDFVAAAARHGLAFLNEAEPGELPIALSDDAPADQARLIRAVQAADNAAMRPFHKTLLVRAEARPHRQLDRGRLRDLLISSDARRQDGNVFAAQRAKVTIADERLAAVFDTVIATWPARLRIGDLIDDEARLDAIFRLFTRELVELHVTPFPGATTVGPRPRASNLARLVVAAGEPMIFTLDHRAIDLTDAPARALLALLDGTRDHAALAREWTALGIADRVPLADALALFKGLALLRD